MNIDSIHVNERYIFNGKPGYSAERFIPAGTSVLVVGKSEEVVEVCHRDEYWSCHPDSLSPRHPACDLGIHVNANGGKQSAMSHRCDLLPAAATLAVAEVLAAGAAKYGERNWRLISVPEHLNHALTHCFKHTEGDTTEPHLQHAACRLLMALEIALVGMDKKEDQHAAV